MKIRKLFVILFAFLVFNSSVFGINFSKRVDVCEGNMELMTGEIKDIGCAHNVFKIFLGDEVKYFKEIKARKGWKSGIANIVNRYCDEFDPKATQKDKELLKEVLLLKYNCKKFINIGVLWDANSKVYGYLHDKIDISELGIPKKYENDFNIDLKKFFAYASKEILQLKHVLFAPSDWFVTNQIATYVLAKYLGIGGLITKSEAVELVTKNGQKRGLLTDEGEGIYCYAFENKRIKATPEFQRQASNLQVLDLITDEKDHTIYNCTFKVQDGKLLGLTAFDSEYCFGYFINNWKSDGDIALGIRYMDKKLAHKILFVTRKDIEYLLSDIFSKKSIDKLNVRIENIKDIIKKSIANNTLVLLDEDEWTSETLQKELENEHSYLKYFFDALGLISD